MSNAYNATIETYAANALAEWIHNIPRRDLSNQPADNQFDPQDRTYWETIGIAALPFVLAALITVLFFLLRCLCNCCCWCCKKCRGKIPELKPPKSRPVITIWVFRVTCLLVVGALVYGFTANELTRRGFWDVKNSIEDMDSMKDESILAIENMLDDVENIVDNAIVMNATLIAVSEEVGGVPTSVLDALAIVIDEFGGGVSSIRDGLDSLGDLPISDVTTMMRDVEFYRYYAQLGILLFITIPFIVVFVAFLCKCRRVLWNITWIGVLCSTLAWILSAVELSGCLVLADLCIDPSQYLLDHAADLDPTIYEYAEFFIVCHNISNPLDSELNTARDAVNATTQEVTTLEDYIDQLVSYGFNGTEADEIMASMENITLSATNILATADNLIETLFKCNRIHNNYVRSLNGICNRTLSGMFGLTIVQISLAIMTWVTIYCAVVMYRYLLDQLRQRRAEKGELMEDEDVGGGEVFAALISPREEAREEKRNLAKAIYPS